MKLSSNTKGFTLVELLVVMGIFAILASFATINLIQPQTQATLNTTVPQITTDIKTQQIYAMSGESNGLSSPQLHGIYFGTTSYTLFAGNSYDSENPSNLEVELEQGLVIENVTFLDNQVVFRRGSGEIRNFDSANNTFDIRNTVSNEVINFEINRYGAIETN